METTHRTSWSIEHPDELPILRPGRGGRSDGASLRWRIWSRVRLDDASQCWLWTGSLTRQGYPRLHIDGRRRAVHRILFYWEHGYWPPVVRHRCDTPACCNVAAHMLGGTLADNNRDTSERGRHYNTSLTHCPSGHPYSEENTYVYTSPTTGWTGRYCRACKAARRLAGLKAKPQ